MQTRAGWLTASLAALTACAPLSNERVREAMAASSGA